MKLNVMSGQTIGIVPQGSRIQSIISVVEHQVTRNLSGPSEFTLMHLDTRTESRAVRALLTTGGPRTEKLHGRYVEAYGPYQVMTESVPIQGPTSQPIVTKWGRSIWFRKNSRSVELAMMS